MRPLISTALLRAQSDERLAALAGDGHEQAFVTIVERYRSALIAFARRIVGEARAEDVVQQAMLKAWVAIGGQAEVTNLKPWLYTIVRNASFDALSRPDQVSEQLTEALVGAEAPDLVVERRLEARDALAALAALPEHQRDALVLTGIEGRSGDEVAGRLGVTTGAVRQLVHRARHTLRGAATAITPLPLVVWAAGKGGGTVTAAGVGAGGAGAAGAGVGASGVVVKVCASLAVTAALAGGATQVIPHGDRPAHAGEAAPPNDNGSAQTAHIPPARLAGDAVAVAARKRERARAKERRREIARKAAADGSADGHQAGQSGDQGSAGQRGSSGGNGGGGNRQNGDHGDSGDQPGGGSEGATGSRGGSGSTSSEPPSDARPPAPAPEGDTGAQGASGNDEPPR